MNKYFQADEYTDGIYWGIPNFKKVLKSPEKVQRAIQKAYNEGYSKGVQEGGESGTTLEPIEITVIEKLVSTRTHEQKLNQAFLDVTTTYVTDADLENFLKAIYVGDNTFAPITINNFDGVSGRTAQSFAIAAGLDNKVYGNYIFGNNNIDFCVLEEKPQDTLSYTKIKNDISNIEDATGQDIYYKYYPNGTSPIGGDDTLPVVWSWDNVQIGDVIGVVLVHLSEGTQAFNITVTDINNSTRKVTAQFGDTVIGTIIVSGKEDNVYGDSTLSFSCPYPVEIHIYANVYTEPEQAA